jgi:hypothetical protein
MMRDWDNPRPAERNVANKPSAADRAKVLTKPFAEDTNLNAWAARMIAAADDFTKNKSSDPLGGFLLR